MVCAALSGRQGRRTMVRCTAPGAGARVAPCGGEASGRQQGGLVSRSRSFFQVGPYRLRPRLSSPRHARTRSGHPRSLFLLREKPVDGRNKSGHDGVFRRDRTSHLPIPLDAHFWNRTLARMSHHGHGLGGALRPTGSPDHGAVHGARRRGQSRAMRGRSDRAATGWTGGRSPLGRSPGPRPPASIRPEPGPGRCPARGPDRRVRPARDKAPPRRASRIEGAKPKGGNGKTKPISHNPFVSLNNTEECGPTRSPLARRGAAILQNEPNFTQNIDIIAQTANLRPPARIGAPRASDPIPKFAQS